MSRGLRSPGIRGRGALLLAAALAACTGDQEVERPAPLSSRTPIEYPLELWDQDMEGRTLLKVRVDARGAVDSAVVLESSGHPAFDSAAIAGARRLRFKPAKKGGEQITVWARVPVHFSKDPRPAPDSLPPDP